MLPRGQYTSIRAMRILHRLESYRSPDQKRWVGPGRSEAQCRVLLSFAALSANLCVVASLLTVPEKPKRRRISSFGAPISLLLVG